MPPKYLRSSSSMRRSEKTRSASCAQSIASVSLFGIWFGRIMSTPCTILDTSRRLNV